MLKLLVNNRSNRLLYRVSHYKLTKTIVLSQLQFPDWSVDYGAALEYDNGISYMIQQEDTAFPQKTLRLRGDHMEPLVPISSLRLEFGFGKEKITVSFINKLY